MGLKCSESFVYLKFGGILIFFFLPLGFPCSGSWHLVLGLWKIENKFGGMEFEEVFMLESLSTCFCSDRLDLDDIHIICPPRAGGGCEGDCIIVMVYKLPS